MKLKIEDISKLKKDEKDFFYQRLAEFKADRILSTEYIMERALRDIGKYMEEKNERINKED